MLANNIFYFGIGKIKSYAQQIAKRCNDNVIFASQVPDPERFEVVEFGLEFKVVSIEEKIRMPKLKYVSVGLHF